MKDEKVSKVVELGGDTILCFEKTDLFKIKFHTNWPDIEQVMTSCAKCNSEFTR